MSSSISREFLTKSDSLKLLINEECRGRETTYRGVNKDIPLPSSINTDKNAILKVPHNHRLLVQVMWNDYEVKSAKSILSTTIFHIGLKFIWLIYSMAKFINSDDGVSLIEDLDSGQRIQIDYKVTATATEGQSSKNRDPARMKKKSPQLKALIGDTSEESFKVQGSQGQWIGPGVFDNHQIHTWFLMRYLETTATVEGSTSVTGRWWPFTGSGKAKAD